VFEHRATRPERIDIGDYTPAEYDRFLKEIKFINRWLGDRRALEETLLSEIEDLHLREFSVLDVAAGSGELLRTIAAFAGRSERKADLVGLDRNERAVQEIVDDESGSKLRAVLGDAFRLPFDDGSFDYAISSLFFHHLTDEQIPQVLNEMRRVARRGVFVIDLHRHAAAYYLYKVFCFAFRISPLVSQDGALSVLKGFRPGELMGFEDKSAARITRVAPFRIVMRCSGVGDLRFDKHLEESK